MIEYAKVDSVSSGNCEDEMVRRLPLTSKNLNKTTGYLTPKGRLAFTKAPIL